MNNHTLMYLNIGTFKTINFPFGTNGKLIDLGVPILRHIRVIGLTLCKVYMCISQGRLAQSVGHLTRKSEVLGSIPGLATNFCFSFH